MGQKRWKGLCAATTDRFDNYPNDICNTFGKQLLIYQLVELSTSFSWQDKTCAEFSTLEVTLYLPYTYHALYLYELT